MQDEIDKFLQMDTSLDGSIQSDFLNMDNSTPSEAPKPISAPSTTAPYAASADLSGFDASNLDEVSFSPMHMFPTPTWYTGPNEPKK